MATNNSRNNRTYKGVYTSNDGNKHSLNVKVFKRLGSFALALVLIKSTHSFIMSSKQTDTDIVSNLEETQENPDLVLIDNIIASKPDITKDITDSEYTVQNGDTLSSIAQDCGNTIKRICALNNMSNKDIIYPGQVLKVEIIMEKSSLDKEISILESYFYDYLFNSNIATMAKDSSTTGGAYYRSILYGNPTQETEIDKNSIYGSFVTNYLHFHDNDNVDDAVKNEYLVTLQNLAKDTEEKLSLGSSAIIVTSEKYNIYIINGTTEYEELQDINHSIYA